MELSGGNVAFFLFLLNWGSQFTAFFFFSARDGSQHCAYDKDVLLGTRSWQGHLLHVLPSVAAQQSGSLPFLCTPLTEVQVCVCVKRSLMAGIVFNHSPYLPQCPACSRCSIHIPKDELRWDASGSQIWKSV